MKAKSEIRSNLQLGCLLLLSLALISCDTAPGTTPPKADAVEVKQSGQFIPADFAAPRLVTEAQFVLKPLGPELVDIDFAAYMSSIDHLQRTFTRSTSWPHANISAEDAMQDMLNEQRRFDQRQSFAYAVLTPDGQRERGCVYVYPSPKMGYDAMVRLWVTQAEYDAGFDAELYEWVTRWMQEAWPFGAVAYPGRAITWPAWEGLDDRQQGQPG